MIKQAMSVVMLLGAVAVSTSAVAESTSWVESEHAWQLGLLFEPGKSQVRREAMGRVFIYSDLKESVVDQALDVQFERIENMMFVRTVRTNSVGDVEMRRGVDGELIAVVQDDDC